MLHSPEKLRELLFFVLNKKEEKEEEPLSYMLGHMCLALPLTSMYGTAYINYKNICTLCVVYVLFESGTRGGV